MRVFAILVATLAAIVASHPRSARAKPSMATSQGSFEQAIGAFRAFAAKQLQIDLAEVVAIPSTEAMAESWKSSRGSAGTIGGQVGRAWTFAAGTKRGGPEVHGWALPDGTVITLHQNLGRLFEEAGVFGPNPKAIDLENLAHRLLWAYGLLGSNLSGVPTLTVGKDGTGTLHFVRSYIPPGGGTLPYRYDWRFKIGAEHRVDFEQIEIKG
jgi:hypothetical protein